MSFLRICFLFVFWFSLASSSGYSEPKKVEKVRTVKKVSRTSQTQPPKKKGVSQKKSLVAKTVPQPAKKPQALPALVQTSDKPTEPAKIVPPKPIASQSALERLAVPKPVSGKPSSPKPIPKKTNPSKPDSQLPSQQNALPAKNSLKIPSQLALKSAIPKDQKLIVIDPGHGGYDLGARISACDEKSLALSTALLVKKYLTEMGYRVILTRSRDVFLPLEKRTSIANETKSKLFVSIHYNSAPNPVAKGVEVFYYASEDKIRKEASKKLATRVLSKVIDRTAAESRGTKEGKFHVIRETHMPAILIEAGFMTHPDELHLLKDINYRDKIARGIAEGVDSFFKL